jgi:2-C-methyl-D-erythritol 4-phosphate cytidylyltransferase
MKKFALIVAGGSGNRMRNTIPKQFIEIIGRPVLMHTIDIFLKYDPEIEIVLVLPKGQVEIWKSLCKTHKFSFNHRITNGGETRFNSVKNGLDIVPDDGIVFIHDGVRPLVSEQTLQNCFESALAKGNALPVIPVSESVRMVEGSNNFAVDRSKYFLVQTPQTFQAQLIKNAYQQAKSSSFTDDATVLENMGETIQLVEGNRENVKITYPEDLDLAEVFLRK